MTTIPISIAFSVIVSKVLILDQDEYNLNRFPVWKSIVS